jgi:hypothetical protein
MSTVPWMDEHPVTAAGVRTPQLHRGLLTAEQAEPVAPVVIGEPES